MIFGPQAILVAGSGLEEALEVGLAAVAGEPLRESAQRALVRAVWVVGFLRTKRVGARYSLNERQATIWLDYRPRRPIHVVPLQCVDPGRWVDLVFRQPRRAQLCAAVRE